MPGSLIRIASDIHYGDRASRVARLAQLRPLLGDTEHLVLNGDTLDTRPGPYPEHTATCRSEVLDFFPREVRAATFLTGNHDANFSPHHQLDLAGGDVFVIHGDVVYDDIVPWSKEAPSIRRRLADEWARVQPERKHTLDGKLAVFRRVAAQIPQRHQAERNPVKHLVGYLSDVAWPPWWILRVMRAWSRAPHLAAELSRRFRPAAKFIVVGHTHRPGIWRMADGLTVINTGSFCPPLGGCVVDVRETSLCVRQVELRRGEFRATHTMAEFPLAR